jgi:hypothetical protein
MIGASATTCVVLIGLVGPSAVGRVRRPAPGSSGMNTLFLQMAQYNGQADIPVDTVCRDYLAHLTPEKFLRKVGAGEIAIPLVRMETSQKSAKGVHVQDSAEWIDKRSSASKLEVMALTIPNGIS